MAMPKVQRQVARETEPAMSGGDALRIVLVGRTGLDGRLRLDPAVELFRARTSLEAVGELSTAARQEGASQRLAIVAPACDPGSAAAGKAEDPGKRREFLASLRRVDPAVRILWLDGGEGASPEGYDGAIGAEAGVEEIRAVLRGEVAGEVPAEPVLPAAVSTHEDLSSLIEPAAAGPGLADTGDEVLARMLIQGRDVADAALELVRRRLGGRDVALVLSGEEEARAGEAGNEAAVAWRGRMLGRLRSRDTATEELAPHASWLAAWLVLRDQHGQLREAAFADPLTGACNRRYFDQFLKMAMDEARKERRGITLLMFDIDDFKQFNDRYGHAAGDDILRETVRLLRSVIRPSDKVCRIGGDEFAVVFHEPTGPRTPSSRPPSDVCQIAERFQREVAAQRFPKLGREAPGPLSISGGLATYPWDGATPEALLSRADELAMQSKRMGKNCITFGPGAEGPGRIMGLE
jgi:two-component system, cell cycle response regulator